MNIGGPEELVEILGNTPVVLRQVTLGLDDAAAQQHKEGETWSIVEVVGHLVDVEQRSLDRLHHIQTEDNPEATGYDPDEMVRARGYSTQSLNIVLETFETSRAKRIAALTALDEAGWQRGAGVVGYGPTTLEQMTVHSCNHDVAHITQIVKLLP